MSIWELFNPSLFSPKHETWCLRLYLRNYLECGVAEKEEQPVTSSEELNTYEDPAVLEELSAGIHKNVIHPFTTPPFPSETNSANLYASIRIH